MITRFIAALGPVVLVLANSGCSVDPETLESLQSAVNTVSGVQSDANEAEPTTEPQTVIASEVQFRPPHPEREDPFTFPAGAEVSNRESKAKTNIAQVEILGFAKIGEQHVLLRSGDKSRSLTAGESIDGVRVIEIKPPMVRLQMGTLIWTATMFDKQVNE